MFFLLYTTFLEVDFKTEDAYTRINKWVNETTEGLIPKFFNAPSDIDPETLLMLHNAITFQGE